ncbi:MAG: sulfite exporter TauE/SafE family protein [Candidatus Binatia bacterium]
MPDPLLLSLGLLVGTLVGLTGVGGGALLTPLLILVVGVRPVVAVGTDLAFAAITKLIGSWQHQRQGTSDRRLVCNLAVGSIPGALLGTQLVSQLAASHSAQADAFLAQGLGIMLLIAASASLLRAAGFHVRSNVKADPGYVSTALLGFIIGLLVGVTSIGAGSLLMAMLTLFYRKMPTAQAVGADVMHGAVLASVAAIAHGSAGHVELPMLMSLLTGSLPGVLLGGWLCSRLPSRPLRVGIAAMLMITGVRLL